MSRVWTPGEILIHCRVCSQPFGWWDYVPDTDCQEDAHEDANIIFGTVTDPTMENEIRMTVIATGFKVAGDSESEADKLAARAMEYSSKPGERSFAGGTLRVSF